MFAQVADEYDRRYGLDDTHLRAIAQLNFANARRNPNAQTRGWTVPDPITDDDATNPIVEGRMRRFDCSQMTDGGAGHGPGQRRLPARPSRRTPDRPHRRLGTSHRRAGSAAEARPLGRRPVRAAARPRRRARRLRAAPRSTLDDLDGFEVHDCFTPSEYLAIDHIGLDRARRVVEGHRERRDRDRRPVADQPQRRADRRRPPGRRFRVCACCSTPPSRSAAPPATIRSRAPRRSAR